MQSGLSVCYSQIALSLWKSEHPHPARPKMVVTTDPWHATHCGYGLDEGVKGLSFNGERFGVESCPFDDSEM